MRRRQLQLRNQKRQGDIMNFRWQYLLPVVPILLWTFFKFFYAYDRTHPQRESSQYQFSQDEKEMMKRYSKTQITASSITDEESTRKIPTKDANSPWLERFNGRELKNGDANLKISMNLRAIETDHYHTNLGTKVKEEGGYTLFETHEKDKTGLLVAINRDSNRTTILKNRLVFTLDDRELLKEIADRFELKLEAKFSNPPISIFTSQKGLSTLILFDLISTSYKDIPIKIETQDSIPIPN